MIIMIIMSWIAIIFAIPWRSWPSASRRSSTWAQAPQRLSLWDVKQKKIKQCICSPAKVERFLLKKMFQKVMSPSFAECNFKNKCCFQNPIFGYFWRTWFWLGFCATPPCPQHQQPSPRCFSRAPMPFFLISCGRYEGTAGAAWLIWLIRNLSWTTWT